MRFCNLPQVQSIIMKRVRIILISFLVLLTIAGIIIYYVEFNYYERGENDAFSCRIGETVEIRLRENGSTGCVNCWLNEGECKIVKQANREYVPSINSRLGYDGAGGIIVLTFKAVTPGLDTIKFANCFVGGDDDCKDFTPENTPLDNMFIIDVRE